MSNMKRSVMINEVIRTLKNCSSYLEKTAAHISPADYNFQDTMKNSDLK